MDDAEAKPLGPDYGVRVQIKALQGHPFVILEDSNDKKHEIPAPDPSQFMRDDSVSSHSADTESDSQATANSLDIRSKASSQENQNPHHQNGYTFRDAAPVQRTQPHHVHSFVQKSEFGRSRSSSGNRALHTSSANSMPPPQVKRSNSNVNVLSRKSSVGTVFALTGPSRSRTTLGAVPDGQEQHPPKPASHHSTLPTYALSTVKPQPQQLPQSTIYSTSSHTLPRQMPAHAAAPQHPHHHQQQQQPPLIQAQHPHSIYFEHISSTTKPQDGYSSATTDETSDIAVPVANLISRLEAGGTAAELQNAGHRVSQDDLRIIRKENSRLEDQLNSAKSRIDQLENLMHEQEKSRTQTPATVELDTRSEDDARMVDLERQIKRLKERVKSLERQKEDVENELDKREADINKIRKLLAEEQSNFDGELEKVRADFEIKEKSWKRDVENAKDELSMERQRSEKNMNKVSREKIFELEEELDKAHEKNDHLSAEVRKLREAARQLGDDVKETTRKLGMSEARSFELEKKSEDAYEKEIESQQRIEELEIRLNHQQVLAKRHDEDLESVYRDVEAAKLEKIALAERVNQLERERLELQDQIEILKQDKEGLLKRIRDVEYKQEELLRARDALAIEAQQLHDKRAQLESEMKDQSMDQNEVTRRLQIIGDQKKALEKQMEDLKVAQGKADQERLALNSQLREAQWQRDAQQRKIIGLEFQVRRRDKEIERLQHYVNQKNQKSTTSLNECPPSPKSDRLNKTLNLELEKLREDALEQTKAITELEQRNQHLQGELTRTESDLEGELRAKQVIEAKLRESEKESTAHRERKDSFEKQFRDAHRQIERMRGGASRTENRLEYSESRMMALEQENLRLEKLVEDGQLRMKESQDQMDEISSKLRAESTFDKAREQIIQEYQHRMQSSEQLYREEKNQYEDRVLELEKLLKTTELEKRKADEEHITTVARLQSARRDTTDIEQEKSLLKKSISTLQKQLDQRTSENDTLELKLHDFKLKMHAKDEEANMGTVEMGELRRQNDKKLRELRDIVREKTEEIERLYQATSQKNADVEDLKLCLADSKDEIHDLKVRLKQVELEKTDRAAKDSMRSPTQDLIKQQLDTMNEEIQRLQSKLKTSLDEKADIEAVVMDLQASLRKSERNKIMLEHEKMDLEERLARKPSDDSSVSSFTTDMSNIDSLAGVSKCDLKRKLREAGQEIDEMKEREKSPILAANAEITALKKTLEDRERVLRNAEETIFKQKDVIEELTTIQQSAETAVIHELKTYQSESELQFAHLKEQLSGSEQEKKGAQKQLEKLERDRDEAAYAVNALRQERDLLLEKQEHLDARLDEADSLSKDLREKLTMITRQKQFLESQLLEIQERSEGLNEEKHEKSEQLHSLVAQKEILLDTVETIKNELMSSQTGHARLKVDRQQLEGEVSLLREKVAELESEIMIVEDQKGVIADSAMKNRLQKVLAELIDEQRAREEVEKQLDYAEAKIEELENAVPGSEDEAERDELVNDVEELKAKLQRAERDMQASADEQKRLQEKFRNAVKEAEKGARGMQDEKRLISHQLKQLHAQLADKDEDIQRLKASQRQSTLQASEMQSLQEQHQSEVNQLKAQLALMGDGEDDMLTEV